MGALEGWKATTETKLEEVDSNISELKEAVLGGEDGSSLAELIQANTEAIAKLNGEVTEEGSVKKQIADAVSDAKTEVKSTTDGLAERLDTLEGDADTEGSIEYKIAALKEEVAGDISTLDASVKANIAAIEKLNGEGEGSVKKTVDDAINKFATDVTNDDVVNSYKELIDWAAEHGADAAEMAAAIQTLETTVGKDAEGEEDATGLVKKVADLEAKFGEGDGSVESMIEDALVDYAKTEDVSASIKTVDDKVTALDKTVNGFDEGETHTAGLVERVETLESVQWTAITTEEIDALFK